MDRQRVLRNENDKASVEKRLKSFKHVKRRLDQSIWHLHKLTRHCSPSSPRFVSSFRLDTQTAMAFASDYLPRVSQANHFVAPYSEAALCLTIYEMLKTFNKVSSGLLLEAATVEQALDINMEGPPKGVSLHVEQPLKELGWGENVEFVIKDQATDKIALVVEVKQTLADKPAALWHILSELAIAARHNQGVAFGTLTNVNCWVFFRVEALQGENGFCVRMSDALWLGTTPIGFGDADVQFIQFMCEALYSEKGSVSQKEVEQALAAVDHNSQQLMQRAVTKYLGNAETHKQLAEIDKQLAEKDKELAEKKKIIAWLKSEKALELTCTSE